MSATSSAARGPALAEWASTRQAYLDNLKVVLITAIIMIHAALGYASTVEVWNYTEFREVTLSPATEMVLFVLVSPFAFFLIALLFMVAGLLTPPSLARKGIRRFVGDRLMRLGLPFVVYVLLVQPTLTYGLEHPLGDAPGSYWDEYLGAEHRLDTGPLWFVGVLLVFSFVYAGWRALVRRTRSGDGEPRTVTVRILLSIAAIVALASFVIRLVYPYGSEAGFSDLNFWEWPACAAVFAVGVYAYRLGWITEIPARLARQCRNLTLLAAAGMAALLWTAGLRDRVDDAMGGWHWAAAGFALFDAMLTVFGSVWLLSTAQRWLDRRYRWAPVLSRSAYGAFMLQTLFLLALALLLRPVELPAEAKALLVAIGAVVCSYAAAWWLISRVPGLSKVL